MIESRAGLAAIPKIAAVEGIDMLFLEPLDLTKDFGGFGDLTTVELTAAQRDAEDKIRASGRLLGGASLPDERAQDMFARGYALATVTSDVSLLRDAAARVAQSIQP